MSVLRRIIKGTAILATGFFLGRVTYQQRDISDVNSRSQVENKFRKDELPDILGNTINGLPVYCETTVADGNTVSYFYIADKRKIRITPGNINDIPCQALDHVIFRDAGVEYLCEDKNNWTSYKLPSGCEKYCMGN